MLAASKLELFDGLTEVQLLGVRGHFLEPPIWEMGHVGWFREYWLLRQLDGAAPLLRGTDEIYDSFNVSYTRLWDHRFPSRAETLAYITAVLERSVARLESREPRNGYEGYLYALAAQHQRIHTELRPRRLGFSLYQGGYGAHDGVVGTHGLAR